METKAISLKYLFFPRNNQWLKRILLVFSFILFDYFSTIIFCNAPYQEANLYARGFMENFGITAGLTLFVLLANMPIYVTLTLDSHLVKFPPKIETIAELIVDLLFAWFVAGLHFSGGTSWFWNAPNLTRNLIGAVLYIFLVLLIIKPYKRH